MKGFEHLIIPAENFTLLCGAQHITRYTFNTHVAVHKFCKVCGIHAFYTPRSHPDSVDVNARCVEGLREKLDLVYFDGQNWEKNIDHLQS